MKPILAAESIGKSFGRNRVLSSAGLWASPGSVAVLLGRNGSGKTTLIKIAAGWLRPDFGVVIFRERRFTRPRLSTLARLGLFYLPDRDLLVPTVSLRRHLEAVRHRFPEARVEDAASRLALRDLLDRKLGTLSGGERRRAELAVAFARSPHCLLADEPFRELMPTEARWIARALRWLADDGCAVVVAGQEADTLLELADVVIWQTAGTTHHLGPPQEAQRHPQFRREYLGLAWLSARVRAERPRP